MMKPAIFLLGSLFVAQATLAGSNRFLIQEVDNLNVLPDGPYYVSEWAQDEIPAGLVSFQIVTFGSPETAVQVTDLVAPDGTVYVESRSNPSKPLTGYDLPMIMNSLSKNRAEAIMEGSGSLIVPNNPIFGAPPAGTWKVRALVRQRPVDPHVSFVVIGKSNELVTRDRLDVHLRIARNSYWATAKHIPEMLAETKRMYETVGIEFRILSTESVDFGVTQPMHLPHEMHEIALKTNSPDAVNVYLMPQMADYDKPINGLACIGGPVGISRPHGCFAALFANHDGDTIAPVEQGRILAHELGHYLGLFHTVDNGVYAVKKIYDPLDDTPDVVTGSNMMDPGVHDNNPTFSPLQEKMMLLSPILN